MATIERKPLPPPKTKATTITEADRAEIIARANDVIDHYLNGPGSYFDAGTRKPLAGELGDNTVADLKNFKNNVIASKQFADDPNSIMDSVIRLIDQTMDQVERTARDNEGRDPISRPPPNTYDPIDDPRVISPRALSNAALPISLPLEGEAAPPLEAGGIPGIYGSKPLRILSRRTSLPENIGPRNPNLPVPPPELGRPLGIVSGKPMPLWTTPVPLGGLLKNSDAAGANDWFNLPVGLGFQNPTPSVPSSQTGGRPERSLGRVIADPSQASVAGMRAPAAPLAPYDNPDYSGGLLGGFALARFDPQNPNQPAPPPADDARDQAKLQALEDKLSFTGDIGDAVALYNARKAIRAKGTIDQA
jgi:hypothetical protein